MFQIDSLVLYLSEDDKNGNFKMKLSDLNLA